MKQQQEEFRRKIELEAEERKLEETLEYQRRIEEEAKQKLLAEQFKNSTGTSPYSLLEEKDAAGSALNVDTVSKQDGLTSNSRANLHSNSSPVCLKDIEFGDFHFSEVSTCKNYPNVGFCHSKHEYGGHDLLLNSEGRKLVGNEVVPSVWNVGKSNGLLGYKMNDNGTAAARGKSSTSSSIQRSNKTINQSLLRSNEG